MHANDAVPLAKLVTLFPHERGPVDTDRAIALGELREWPAPWIAGPAVVLAIGDPKIEAFVRDGHRFRYFSATDPDFPHVPLLRAELANTVMPRLRNTLDPRLPADTGIRDKVWQRLFVEEGSYFPQPGFALVNGSRIEACNARWRVRIAALDGRPVQAVLRSAAAPGTVVVVEGVEAGFAAFVVGDGVRLVTQSPQVAALLDGTDLLLSAVEWDRFVNDVCAQPLPLGNTKAVHNTVAEITDALLHAPGSYILKPRCGSNGFGVVRIVSRADGWLTVESDCPDTAAYLAEFPADPAVRGRDLVAAAAVDRLRFADRARVGLSERALGESIIEEEIRQDRSEGSFFEPRVVIQRVRKGSGEGFATLGAICKRIDSAVGACVARDFKEEPLEASLHCFLRGRVPDRVLALQVRRTRDDILAVGDRLGAAIVPVMEARGARIHQLGIDCRLCWNTVEGRSEYHFLEVQFGIGRIDWLAVGGQAFEGFKTGVELREEFGQEVG